MPDTVDLHETLGAVELPRDFVRVAGPDAMKFLQGQLSQQVDVPVGTSGWTLLLQPQGKVVAFLRFTRTGPEEYVLDTDGGWAPAVIERLNRFKLRVKADVEAIDGWRCVAVRGPGAHEAVPAGGRALAADWPGLPGVDLIGPADEVELPAGIPLVSLEAYEVARIEAGVPVMGRELDESTIPAEAGVVDRSVAFDKGCYTGQELVARIDSRGGNVPRRLRGIVVGGDGAAMPPVGATIHTADKEVGALTSVARSSRLGTSVALAYVRRAVEPPADVELRWDGGRAPAQVLDLPVVS